MKVLQIGLGSMGKRRVRNLQYLGIRNIIGYDTRNDRLDEASRLYNIEVVNSLDVIDFKDITHIIISTPPDKHSEYVELALNLNKHVFIEASVVDDQYNDLIERAKNQKHIIAPSCTMRFDPLNQKVKEVLDSKLLGKNIFLQHHFGLYLPYWHPYESIKDFYVSKRTTGAAREIVPFDLVYISWFIGKPQGRISGLITKTDNLDVDIDDIYSLQYQTEDKCHVQFTIDVVSKKAYRTTRIVCENGSIELDTVKGELSIFNANENKWQIYTRAQLATTKSTEEMYVLEMQKFINSSLGKDRWNYTLEDDWEVLNWLYKAEKDYTNNGQ
ncbi:Gfo/Idh/MocA family oxidoreductase [Aliarcobacter skirrowii]|uniref:Gfo/Idh/MocA family protein n=1 Tax=Aliarcobacter skirrowii TaxID=28200 RepID=UPI0029B8458E|nr:Gfo/Idh/MocA family oxidoreductase [Aliarcobacter skirrowii]MDX4059299.1 Gfo/Idh/MocA family oxidoreductase [Aliarcobacter skirrowii]